MKELDENDPRLDAEARRVVRSGRYMPVEDGQGGVFLRLVSDTPDATYPASRFFRQPAIVPTIQKPKGLT